MFHSIIQTTIAAAEKHTDSNPKEKNNVDDDEDDNNNTDAMMIGNAIQSDVYGNDNANAFIGGFSFSAFGFSVLGGSDGKVEAEGK